VNFSQFLDAAHISTLNCNKMAGDRPDNLHMKFSELNIDFSSPKSRPPKFKVASAGRHQRQLPP